VFLFVSVFDNMSQTLTKTGLCHGKWYVPITVCHHRAQVGDW